jgi:hypothetical protein
MHFTKYPEPLRTIYYKGEKIDASEYKPKHVEIIDGIMICTCGKTLTHLKSIYRHKKSAYHLAHDKS